MMRSIPRSWFFAAFTLSGFAGLIYESIWSHYLKLFLGHAAYAQTVVLAIFMGGMAIGSWVCSRYSGRWSNLLMGYAMAEAVIGMASLVFHRTFVGATALAYDSIMPALGSPLAVTAFKWGLSTLLILPQSILLGMTFPLMSAGLIRVYPAGSGGTIAMLYFTNSLGAAVGVLASGFFLIGAVGLPGTIMTAGLLNIVLAISVWMLAKNMPVTPTEAPRREERSKSGTGYRLMLTVAALTGAASFMYEIGWIRMLSMVLGSSTHAFELMLSVFILGLAFGGLWIKRRIDRVDAPERFLGVVQVAMGFLALATLVVYGETFEVMQWLLAVLARTESSYVVFNLGSHLIAMLVMFPAAFCAGMTLPLITYCLLQRGSGERAIGAVYAANTVGAIVGVMVAVHVGLPFLGLKGLITAGAAVDIGLGIALLWCAMGARRIAVGATVVGVLSIVATLAFVFLDPYKMASGVYRHGALLKQEKAKILFHHDGKTATVNLVKTPGRVSIHTNGKSDAALDLDGGIAPDEPTMVLTGALPLAYMPDAKTAANIGFGSGLSSHVLAASDGLRQLDTIEIEAAMVEAARGFRPRNEYVYGDPRSHIHIEDAKTFFSTHNKRYDIIASEPSNPWVSGVAGLFSREFYASVRRHLSEGGIFAQWMQLYEISPALVASVFKALSREFSDYAVFTTNNVDLVIIARNGGTLPPMSPDVFRQPRLAAELARINIRNVGDLELHRVGGRKALQPYFENIPIAANSDYFPILDLNAAKARFMGATASDAVNNLGLSRIPALEMLSGEPGRGRISDVGRPWLRKAELTRAAFAIKAYLLDGRAESLEQIPSVIRSDVQLVRFLAIECVNARETLAVDHLFEVANALSPFLTREELRPVWQRITSSRCAERLHEPQRTWVALLAAVAERDAANMIRLAEALLDRDQERKEYLLSAAITGHLALNQRERALRLWRQYADRLVSLPHDMLPELLRGHLFAAPESGAMKIRAQASK
jgi:spermidine synthase